MRTEFTERQKAIINKVFADHNPEYWLSAFEDESLAPAAIEEACGLLSGEFHMEGIDENFEANEYGQEIEQIIDLINQPRLR